MTSSANPPARLSAAVKLLLLFAAVAVAGLIVPFWVDPAIGKSGTAWRQGFGALAVSIVGLSGLLLWIAPTRGPIQAFCLVFGVLAGLCLVVDAAIGLAVFDYGVSRDAAVALRIVRVVPGAAALAAVAGCMLGFFAGTALSFVQRRAKKSPSTNAASGRAVSGPRQWVLRLVGGALLAGVGVALYFPVAYELRRRHAVLSLRASGAELDIEMQLPAINVPLGWELLAWLRAGGTDYQTEGVLYSLESVRAIELTEPIAGDVQMAWIARLPEVTTLSLNDAQLNEESWQQLASLPTLNFLYAARSNITDEGLQHLSVATSLRHLALGETEISDQGLEHLAGLWLLTHLDLSRTAVTDDGLRHLAGMVSLRGLALGDTRVSGGGLKHLAAIQGLMQLDLSRTELSQSGLATLSALPQLMVISCEGARFNEGAFRELGRLPQVRSLQLHDTNVVDAWLPHLAGMKNPRLDLTLGRTGVTAQGLRALRQSLPQANVSASHLEKRAFERP